MKKIYTDEELSSKFEILSNPNKVDILYSAISYMKRYKINNYQECIIMAMNEAFNN